jgi:hypothetical protein
MTVKLHPNCTEKAFDGTVCSARLQEVRGGLTRQGGHRSPRQVGGVTGFDQFSGCQFHDESGVVFHFAANGSRAWKAHGPASHRVFRKKIHAQVACRGDSSMAATTWWVRGSKTKYSPGMSEANWLKRKRAVSKSATTASKTGFPRRSFLRMSNEDNDIIYPTDAYAF